MNEQKILKALGDRDFDSHLDDMMIAQFIDKTLTPDKREMVLEHIADCKSCRDLVMQSQRDIDTKSTTPKPANNINMIMPILAIASSFFIIIFISFEDDTIIYKGSSDIVNLELPKLEYNTTSSCSQDEQDEAMRHLKASFDIEDESSYIYYKTLVDSMSACYSPEVATKVYIIKAQNSKGDKQMRLLKDALTHSASIRDMKFKLKKEILILKLLKPHFSGIHSKDVEKRIQMKESILDEVSK